MEPHLREVPEVESQGREVEPHHQVVQEVESPSEVILVVEPHLREVPEVESQRGDPCDWWLNLIIRWCWGWSLLLR